MSVNYASDGTPSLCGEEETCSIDGVLLSHAHVDHYGYLGMLRPDIPIYLSPISRKIIELKNDIREDWQTRVNLDALVPVEKEKDFDIGNINIIRYDVDHSVLGASAFIIRAEDKTIAYTGDMRFHGNTIADSEEFLSYFLWCIKSNKSQSMEQIRHFHGAQPNSDGVAEKIKGSVTLVISSKN